MAALEPLTVEIKADTSQFVREIKRTARLSRRLTWRRNLPLLALTASNVALSLAILVR